MMDLCLIVKDYTILMTCGNSKGVGIWGGERGNPGAYRVVSWDNKQLNKYFNKMITRNASYMKLGDRIEESISMLFEQE